MRKVVILLEPQYFSKIVETDDIEEVNKLCSKGWLTLGIKNKVDGNFIYSLGKTISFNDFSESEDD